MEFPDVCLAWFLQEIQYNCHLNLSALANAINDF